MSYVNNFSRTRPSGDVTVRLADYSDASALNRLAALDDARVPDGPVLLAEVGHEPVAALPLQGGRPIADPFHRTTALVEMLDLRARQLRNADERRDGPAERLRGSFRAHRVRPHTS